MNGKLDKNGKLWIERAGLLKEQFCLENQCYTCGDQCPQFGEPERTHADDDITGYVIQICQNRDLLFDNTFKDERQT